MVTAALRVFGCVASNCKDRNSDDEERTEIDEKGSGQWKFLSRMICSPVESVTETDYPRYRIREESDDSDQPSGRSRDLGLLAQRDFSFRKCGDTEDCENDVGYDIDHVVGILFFAERRSVGNRKLDCPELRESETIRGCLACLVRFGWFRNRCFEFIWKAGEICGGIPLIVLGLCELKS